MLHALVAGWEPQLGGQPASFEILEELVVFVVVVVVIAIVSLSPLLGLFVLVDHHQIPSLPMPHPFHVVGLAQPSYFLEVV